ncbi:hypothetical protein [Sphingomonas jaspsi]|uniref:hypothetical protein n=1 Tax=Sphingomonas jaspsi TaxID=392409 RepID=UPI0012ECA899|nr:hypothetical protein [Sphingomonas jaspsi]
MPVPAPKKGVDAGIDEGFAAFASQAPRFYADFTGIHAEADRERLALLANLDEGNFDDTVAIGEALAARTTGFDGSIYVSTPGSDDSWARYQFMGPSAIGLSGFAGTGKTEAANYIESQYGYQRRHIAEPLRDMLRTLLRRFKMDDVLIDRYLTGDLKEEVIPCLGITSRRAQITLGTEWGRELVNNDLWARCWAVEGEGVPRSMNDSVRFPNEERAIQDELKGFTIMIERPGKGPVAFKHKLGKFLYDVFGSMWGVHPSERTDLLNPDYVISNHGTLDDLYAAIDDIMRAENVYTKPTAEQL